VFHHSLPAFLSAVFRHSLLHGLSVRSIPSFTSCLSVRSIPSFTSGLSVGRSRTREMTSAVNYLDDEKILKKSWIKIRRAQTRLNCQSEFDLFRFFSNGKTIENNYMYFNFLSFIDLFKYLNFYID
jgi:hypothetical protein